jgi:hypothetical protein
MSSPVSAVIRRHGGSKTVRAGPWLAAFEAAIVPMAYADRSRK